METILARIQILTEAQRGTSCLQSVRAGVQEGRWPSCPQVWAGHQHWGVLSLKLRSALLTDTPCSQATALMWFHVHPGGCPHPSLGALCVSVWLMRAQDHHAAFISRLRMDSMVCGQWPAPVFAPFLFKYSCFPSLFLKVLISIHHRGTSLSLHLLIPENHSANLTWDLGEPGRKLSPPLWWSD